MGYNVVIVDDDESILESLETYIKTKEELNVICFEDPMKAIDFAKINTVHVSIVDIVLPQMDGLELVKNLKS
nr:response regulator [Petrotogaceae bacterium]